MICEYKRKKKREMKNDFFCLKNNKYYAKTERIYNLTY